MSPVAARASSSSRTTQRLLGHGEVALPLVAGVPEWVSPLVAVVPGQLVALRLAELRGVDLDNPLGLSKITLTR